MTNILPHVQRTLVLLVVFASQLVSGCGVFQNTEPRGWPGVASDIRVQWTGEPGIEITGGVAVPVRAYLESYDLVEFTGSFDNAYPGFFDEVPPNEPTNGSDSASTWDRRPTDKYPVGWSLAGNLRFHSRSVEHTDGGATVTLCEYRYALGQRKPDGTYIPYVSGGRPVDRGIFGVRLTSWVSGDMGDPGLRGPSLRWIDAGVDMKAETASDLKARYQPVRTTATPDVWNTVTEMLPKGGYLASDQLNAAFTAAKVKTRLLLAADAPVIVINAIGD